MKVFLALVTFMYMSSVSAKGITPLTRSDLSLTRATSELVSVQNSVATVRVVLSGCLDRLGGHFSKFEMVDGKGILYFGALNIHNSASENVRCIRPPEEILKINVPFDSEIELVTLDFNGTIQLQ